MAQGAQRQVARPAPRRDQGGRPPRRPPTRRRAVGGRSRLVILLGVLAFAAVVGVGAILARTHGSTIPGGVRVAGVDVGGMSSAQARSAIALRARKLIVAGLALEVGSAKGRVDLRKAGVVADVNAAVADAVASRDALSRIEERLGVGGVVDVPLRFRVDAGKLEEALAPFASRVEQGVQPADVRKTKSGVLTVVAGKGGIGIDRKRVIAAIGALAKTRQPLRLDLTRVEPAASTESARAAKAAGDALLATDHVLVLGRSRVPLPRSVLVDALTFSNEDGMLRMRLERPALAKFLRRTFGRNETQPANARFTAGDDGKLEIAESITGRIADENGIASTLERNPRLAAVPVSVVNKPPAFSTEDARKLGITDLVAEFETPYDPGYPRVTNIKRAVEILDGTILKPNETFDLNQRLGERTVDRGFVLAPMIDEGRLKDDVGGGVSQIATMLYNGAFLSGLKLIHHTPHSFYITRYPMGREATVSWGGPELTFQNDWAAPLVINLQAFDDHIIVRFFSRSLGRRIEYGTDEPTDIVEAKTRKVLNSQLAVGETKTVQEGGQQGFAVTYWRKVFAGSKLRSNETFSWTYHPEDTIVEVGPTPPPPPPASSSEETPTSSEEPPTTEPPPSTATEPPPTSGAASS